MLWDDDEAPEEDKKEDANPEEILKEGTENAEEIQQNNEIITKKNDSE
jgi:hypothetical protein